MPWWLWLVWVLLVAVGVAFGFRFQVAKNQRVLTHADEEPLASYVGGLRWPRKEGARTGNATTPLARLSILSWGVRLGPSVKPLRWMVPTWEATNNELVEVDLIKSA